MCIKSINNLLKEMEMVIRYRAGIIYVILGTVLLTFIICSMVNLLLKMVWQYIWCLGWASFGIGCGLINSRYDDCRDGMKYPKSRGYHYFFYFVFVLFISALAAFVVLVSNENNFPKAYASSALVAIVIGFTGDKLAGILFELRKP